jgi:hypothetical protein
MKSKNKIIYNQTSIYYNIIQKNNIKSLFLNYLSFSEINQLTISHPEIFQTMAFIHMVLTIPDFRNQKNGTASLIYFKQVLPDYPVVLFCENNYINFDLIKWYQSLGFITKYSNLESTLLQLS